MSSQNLIWTALPNGWSSSRPNMLSLCVYLSPRLLTDGGLDGRLTDFPDFIDWPRTASHVAFDVSFGGGAPISVTPDTSVLDSALWKALFKRDTFVHSYQFPDLSARRIRSYPVNEVFGTIRQIYQSTIRKSGAELPSLDALNLPRQREKTPVADLLGIATNAETDNELEHDLARMFDPAGAVTVAQVRDYAAQSPAFSDEIRAALNFYQLRKFHEFNAKQTVRTVTPVPHPKFDFHEVLSSLARFPKLLRPLGLAFDLVVPLAPSITPQSDVRTFPSRLSLVLPSQHAGPRTRYRIDQNARMFLPAPSNDSEIVDGVLRPGASEYNVIQVDVDGAAMKLSGFASNIIMMRYDNKTSIDTPDHAGLPALRTSGFSVACTDRAYKLRKTLQDGKVKNDSLGSDPKADKMFLTTDDVTRGFVIDVHDSATGEWHSLCGRSGTYKFLDAGLTRTYDDEGLVSLNVTEPTDGSPNDLRLHESLFHWQGWSLAVTRPGQIVDTESNPGRGDHPAGADYRLETSFVPRKDLPLPRLRFGWNYKFRLRAVDLAGNSLRIDAATDDAANLPPTSVPYLRYDPIAAPFVLAREDLKDPEKHPGESFERIVIRSNFNKPFAGPAERHIAPPKASQLLAETHGMFDNPKTGKLDSNAYALIIDRDKSFDKDAVHPETQLAVPYLPDPLARGAGLFGTSGPLLGISLKVDFDGGWPDTLPFRISLVEGGGTPSFDATTRVLTIPLRKAEVAALRLSSFLNEPDLELMAAWQLALDSPPASFNAQEFKNLALAGLLWMLTPFRELTLVHAVQQPLLEPKFQRLTATRSLGDTFAVIADDFPIDGKSTDKVALWAEWHEPIDDGKSDTAPAIISGGAQAFEIRQATSDNVALLTGRHEFHDTKYRSVTYQAVATTRFREYFPITITKDANNLTRMSPKITVDVLNAAPPIAPKILYVLPAFVWEDASDSAWQTRKRQGSSLRVYLDRPWFSSGEGELLGVVLWNCAPPRQDATEGIEFVSVPGPLSISIPVPKLVPLTPQVPDHLVPYVTEWAMDPIFDGLPTPTQTTPYFEHFRNAVKTDVDLPLLETSEFTVAVAGHEVAFDSERKLWYCDIDIDGGDAYYPFIRLALARFQPKSVRGAHLSRVVLADFAQLAPDRSASISFDGADPHTLTVAVCGIAPATSVPEVASRVAVGVQVKEVDQAGREIWIPISETELHRAVASGVNPVLWTASIVLPQARGAKPMRLIIKEYERLTADAGDRSDITLTGTAERLVYADVINI